MRKRYVTLIDGETQEEGHKAHKNQTKPKQSELNMVNN